MSKFDALWNWIKANGSDSFTLTFAEIEKIAGLPIDHSFLNAKKELTEYGFSVGKISMKEQKVAFEKVSHGDVSPDSQIVNNCKKMSQEIRPRDSKNGNDCKKVSQEIRPRDSHSRTEAMLGAEAVEKLAKASVCVFGVGGVGGFCVEALARAGVGRLVLYDADEVDVTNINRQIIALHSTVGRPKVEVMRERIADIDPECEVEVHQEFVLPANADKIDFSAFTYVVDAIDTVTAKIDIICRCKQLGVPVISCMGAGNKLDPTAFRVADIYETSVCPLAKAMRKELKARNVADCKVVYSKEPPVHTELGRTPGSVSFVPSVAGLILAGEVIKDITER